MKILLLIALLLTLTQEITHAAELPELPRVYLDTRFSMPSGQRHVVTTTSEFKTALIESKLGDIIEMKAGVTFYGPFTLPKKTSGSGWIYIISSEYAKLPAPSVRVSPADRVNMPKIVVGKNNGGTVNMTNGSHHYRFVGIEFAPVDGDFVYNVIVIGGGEKTEATQPNNIVIDRCYIHGDPASGSRRGVLLNGGSLAVIDCHVSDCKEDGADSQALAGYSGTGPIKIVNNFLEGAGENVMFGGADPTIPDAVPSDIEMRCNHFFKPLSWMQEEWDIKNLLEFKNSRRVLVEGNLFENCWPNAQSGFALLLSPRNQNNTAPWSAVQDITIRHNRFKNIAQGINMSGFDAPNISQRTSRILIQNNVLKLVKIGVGSDGRLFQVLNGPTDVTFDHNTGFGINSYVVSDGTPKTDFFSFKNNMVAYGTYGFIGSGTGYANTTLARYFNDNWEVTHNAVIGGNATNYPTGNFFPKNNAAVGFADTTTENYRLTAASPYKNLGNDGKDIGADLDSLEKYSIYTGDGLGVQSVSMRSLTEKITVYPMPADKMLHLDVEALDAKIVVMDLLGREVMRVVGHNAINVSGLAPASYLLRVSSRGVDRVTRFVVAR